MSRIHEQGFAVGFKRGLVKKMLNKRFRIKGWFKKQPEWLLLAIKDCDCFDEQLCETLHIADPETKEEFISIVNAHLELEAKIQVFEVEPKEYTLGEAHNIFGYESENVLGV